MTMARVHDSAADSEDLSDASATEARSPRLNCYRLYGLTVFSEIDLPEPTIECSAPDVKLLWEDDAGNNTPAGPFETLAELSIADRPLYRMVRTDDGITIDFHNTCTFRIDHELSCVRCSPAIQVDDDFVSILATGNLMAFILTLGGSCVLHASSVVSRGRGLAVVGSTGMGKSSCATLFCAAGAELMTDDVLRVELDDSQPRVIRGSSHLRLREPALSIVDLFQTRPESTETVDGRLAVYPNRGPESAPLDAVIVPMRGREGDIVVERLSDGEAMWTLIQAPRIYGWKSPEVLSRSFTQLSEIVERVPVLNLRMPWGPPFPADLGERALDEIHRTLGRDEPRSSRE